MNHSLGFSSFESPDDAAFEANMRHIANELGVIEARHNFDTNDTYFIHPEKHTAYAVSPWSYGQPTPVFKSITGNVLEKIFKYNAKLLK
jgi:hypothetical protein